MLNCQIYDISLYIFTMDIIDESRINMEPRRYFNHSLPLYIYAYIYSNFPLHLHACVCDFDIYNIGISQI